MAHEISRREVLNNLIRFKDSLLEIHRDLEKKEEKERKYKALLNRKTGDMRFTQKISALEHRISRKGIKKEAAEDWKEVQIFVQQKTVREAAHFEVRDMYNQPLKPSDIEPLAWKVSSETLHVLNKKAQETKGRDSEMLAEEAVLHDLSSIHLAVPKEEIADFPGWMGSMSRIDAEHALKGKPIGTYLLREGDEITLSIAFHFSQENLLSVHPYILTVVEKDLKIADILLLQTDKGWTLYYDDPNFKDSVIYHYSASPQGVLHQLSQIARYPLL